MPKLLRKILSSIVIAALVSTMFTVSIASALAPTGTMTGTVQTLTVGTTVAMNTITVTSGGTEITAADDLNIKIPATVGAIWDTTDTTAVIVQSSTGVTSPTVTFADSNKTVILDVTTNFANGENVQISGLNYVPQYASAAAALTWSVDAADLSYLAGNANTQITVIPEPQLTASITLGLNSVVGTAGSTTLTLTPPSALANTDTMVFTMPTNFSVPQGALTMTDTALNGAGVISCTGVAATRVITCTTDGAITADLAGSIAISGIESLWDSAAATNIADLTINNVAAGAGADIALDATVAVADTTPEVQLTSSITLGANSVVGVAGSTTLTLTPPRALANTDTMVFTMPTNFSVPQGALTMTDTALNGAGVISCTGVAATRVITCTTDGAITADLAGSIAISGILSLWNSDGATNTADLTINDVAAGGGLDIALDATTAVPDTTVGAVSSTNVESESLVVGSSANSTITFTAVTAIPNNGKIIVTYPTGFNVAGANGSTASSLSGLDGTWTATVSGQVVTFTQSGGTATAAGAKSLKIANIVTPGSTGSTGTYTITTQTGDFTIETDAAVAADTIVSGSSSSSGGGSSSGSSSTTTTTTTTTPATTTTTTATTETEVEDTPITDDSTETEETTSKPVEILTESGEAVTINDINNHWADSTIEVMVEKGIVKGNPDGTFKPNNSLNRAEAAALLFRVLNMGEDMAGPEVKPFTDVDLGLWYTIYIDTLKTLGVVKGNPDGTYKPGNNINRAEFLTIAMNAYYYQMVETMGTATSLTGFSDIADGVWYENVVYLALEMKFVMGTVCGESMCFNPSSEITRAEATQILYNIFYKEVAVPDAADEAVVEEDVAEEDGPASDETEEVAT